MISSQIQKAQMMSISKKSWNYCESEELNSQLIELPYVGNNLSFIVLLLREQNDLEKLKSYLDYYNTYQAFKFMIVKEVDIYLPKFKVEQKYSKKWVFKNGSDLSRISDQKNLEISQVLHKVVIEVDEKGSEVATKTVKGLKARKMQNSIVFKANHPFIYFIIDKRNDLTLFVGQI